MYFPRISNILTVEAQLPLVKRFYFCHFLNSTHCMALYSISDTKKMEKIKERALRLYFVTISHHIKNYGRKVMYLRCMLIG